jgi:phosphatidylglycerol---prolipoprotein diacylglyceryl transferase
VTSPAWLPLLHGFFEWLGIAVGFRLFLRGSGTTLGRLAGTKDFGVSIGCIFGAALGNKAVHWLQRADQWGLLEHAPWLLFQGQSIVGGLLGGLLGVELAKSLTGVTVSTGDRFVSPILVGLAVGRIGCFLAGLQDDTYGIATTLPWGIDFGDGIQRHPTQLYDMAFALIGLWLWNLARPSLAQRAGLGFKLMLSAYLFHRLLIDALKPVPYAWLFGLSGIQLTCAAALAAYLPITFAHLRALFLLRHQRFNP